MRAELAGIQPVAARRSFAAGCARAAFSQPMVLRSVMSTALLAATAIVGLVITGGIVRLTVRLEMCALIVLLVGLAYAGRRGMLFGPVGPSRAARVVRGGLYVGLGFTLISSLVEERLYPSKHNGMPVAYVFVIVLIIGAQASMLSATARGSRMPVRAVAIGSGFGLVGGLAWFAASMSRPAFGVGVTVPLLVALISAVAAVLISLGWASPGRGAVPSSGPASGPAPADGSLSRVWAAIAAGLAAAGTALMLMSFLADAAMVAFTSKVPDIVGPVMVPGSTAAQKLSEDMIEVGDTYFGVFVFGGIAFAALGVLISVSKARIVASSVAAVVATTVIAIAFSMRWPSNIYAGTAGALVAIIGLTVLGRRTRLNDEDGSALMADAPVAGG